MKYFRNKPYLYIVVLLLVFSVGCQTINPTEDKLVVRTEQALKISLPIYDKGMDWYMKNYQTLPQGTKDVFLVINKEFPPVYRATDDALQLYKAHKDNDLLTQIDKLNSLVAQLLTLVKINGGPDFSVQESK